jgi:hypothetical protein
LTIWQAMATLCYLLSKLTGRWNSQTRQPNAEPSIF